jgi:hypothetical protein
METLVRVTPVFGVLNLAIFSDTGLTLSNQLTVNGHAANDADVYTNGNFMLNNNTSIGGSVLAQGNATIGQGIVKVDTWAGGNVTLSSGVSVQGNATAAGTLSGSQGSISMNSSTVYGNAKAKGSITLSNNSVVQGTRTPNATGVAPPPLQALPHLCWPGCTGDNPANGFQLSFTSNDPSYNTTCVQPSGCIVYTERDYSGTGTTACTSARNDIANWFGASSGNYVVVINAACPLQWGNNTTVNLKGHLAIMSFGGGSNCGANANIHGAICSVNNVTFNSVGGTWHMILIRPWQSGLNCSTGDYDISISNSTVLNGLKTFIYSQCVVNFGNNNASGVNTQLIGGTVNITNQMVLNFDPILSPNVKITAYNLGPSYLREIANGT